MNNTIPDPIHGSQYGSDTNGHTHKPEPEPETPVVIVCGITSVDHSVVSNILSKNGSNSVNFRRDRPTRACTTRPPRYVDPPVFERRSRLPKEMVVEEEGIDSSEDSDGGGGQCRKVVTCLVREPTIEEMSLWRLRSMWEFASILSFLNVFRPLLNLTTEFSAEELESALLNPNGTLGDVHIPLLKSTPPVTRMAYGLDNWVSVLCRKMRDWWHLVAEGELPIVSSQGAEIETYKNLDPAVRVVILKALCDIRVEQEDIRSYIDNSIKHGVHLSAFRKQRVGGDSHGISYWYEDDEIVGHRLYREIRKVERKVEVKKGKIKGSHDLFSTSYEWETVATNLDEFLDVSEKLFTSQNRTEVSLGKKLKNYMLPEIEKIQKRKEKLLKKQQRQSLLLDTFGTVDGPGVGRSLRDRKPVMYTFDDFDRSINEALKVTKHHPSTEPGVKREFTKSEPATNGRLNGSTHASRRVSFSPPSPSEYDEMDEDQKCGPSDRSSRRRHKPQKYSEQEFVGTISDDEEYVNEEIIDSDEEIVGEAVYYDKSDRKQRKQKRKKVKSSSEDEGDDSESDMKPRKQKRKKVKSSSEDEGDDSESDMKPRKQKRKKVKSSSEDEGDSEEFHSSDENREDDVEEEEDSEEDSMSGSEDSDQPRGRIKERELRARRGTKLRSVGRKDASLRRSKRATRTNINYQQYEYSDSETESLKRRRKNPSETASQDSDEGSEEEPRGGQFGQDSDESNEVENQENGFDQSIPMANEEGDNLPSPKYESQTRDDYSGVGGRRFLDLNELAPGSGFDDGLNAVVKDDDGKNE